MEEISDIVSKYDQDRLLKLYDSIGNSDELIACYFEDIADILDAITRIRNTERNASAFSLDDAPILGLLVRLWKLLRLNIWIYKEDSAEFAPIAERSIIEVAVVATYLLDADSAVIEDYRKCSYKNRLRILEAKGSGSSYYKSKAGKRIVRSIEKKLALEGLDETSFSEQELNRWRVSGKSFYDIFCDVMEPESYASTYGVASESVHASWQDILGYSLHEIRPRKFAPQYDRLRVSIAHMAVILPFVTMPYRQWTTRIGIDDIYIDEVLDWMEKINSILLLRSLDVFYGE